jgi:hypothetical protein
MVCLVPDSGFYHTRNDLAKDLKGVETQDFW